MILFVALIAWLLIVILAIFESSDYSSWDLPWTSVVAWLGFVILGIWFLIVIFAYTGAKSELRVIDEKIVTITQMNEQRVRDIMPILNKYPELEKGIIGGINPNNFAVIGSVYPNLKSNEIYQEQAKVIKENLKKLEDLRISKLDKQKTLYEVQLYIWFLK